MQDASIELILSLASFSITVYYWLVQARRERPQLRIFQISGLRAVCRRNQQRDDAKRLCVQQFSTPGVLIANNSSRQNSIVFFDCWLLAPGGLKIRGDWGTVGDDRPPWNIGPDSTIALSLACFFDVPLDFEIPASYEVRVGFVSASGLRFWHTFAREVPAAVADSYDSQRVA